MRLKMMLAFGAAFVLEVGSTFYINGVAEKDISQTMIWAFLGSYIALPFAGFIADEKAWGKRILIASASAMGYTIGCLFTMLIIS